MIRFLVPAFLAFAMALPLRAADEPNFNGRTLSEWLAILKDDPLVRKRKAALVALGQMVTNDDETRKKAMPGIAKAVKVDTNAGVRTQAAILMGRQPTEAAALVVGDLAEALRSEKDSDARKALSIAAGNFGRLSGSCVLPLADVLKDAKAETRAAAADALGRIGKEARKAAPYVVPLAKDADRAVRYAAVFALGRLDPDDSETACETLVNALERETARSDKERDGEMIAAAIVSLGLLGEKSTDAAKAIAKHLGDRNAERRQLAALTLGRFGIVGRIASAELKKAFQEDADKIVRANALHSLGVSYGAAAKELIPVLTSRLKADPDFEVRIAIAEMLGSLGPDGKDAIPALREARRDSQLKVREAATLAIRAIEKPAEKPPEKPKP